MVLSTILFYLIGLTVLLTPVLAGLLDHRRSPQDRTPRAVRIWAGTTPNQYCPGALLQQVILVELRRQLGWRFRFERARWLSQRPALAVYSRGLHVRWQGTLILEGGRLLVYTNCNRTDTVELADPEFLEQVVRLLRQSVRNRHSYHAEP